MSDVGKGGTLMLEAIGMIICIIIAVICAKKRRHRRVRALDGLINQTEH